MEKRCVLLTPHLSSHECSHAYKIELAVISCATEIWENKDLILSWSIVVVLREWLFIFELPF